MVETLGRQQAPGSKTGPVIVGSPLQVETEPDGSLRLRGELDSATAGQLEKLIAEVMRPGRPVIIDMTELSFIDSSGIRVLIRAYQTTGERVVICNPSRQARRILELLDGRAKPEAWMIQTD